MFADNENIIDLVVSTVNIIQPGNSLIVAGNSIFQGNVTISGTLSGGGITPINIGTGVGIFKQISGGNSEFKSILAGTGIGITNLTNEMQINVTATASQISSTASAPVTATNVQTAINQLATNSHEKNKDTILDDNGTNEISALELRQHLDLYLELLDTTGGLTIPTSNIDIPFNSQVYINSNYSHTPGTAVITFNSAGIYNITYKATTEITTGIKRTNVEFKLQIDTGGGYTDIDRSKSNVTNRTTGSGPETTYSTNILTIASGDKIKLTAIKVVSGVSTVKTVDNQTNIIIFKIK